MDRTKCLHRLQASSGWTQRLHSSSLELPRVDVLTALEGTSKLDLDPLGPGSPHV